MWNRPDILDTIANALFAAALLLFAYGTVHFVVRLPAFPLREVHIKDPPAHVTLEEIEAVVKREFKGNFFTLDLETARAGLAALPWVRNANMRRLWPDRLEVELEEHMPLARWGTAALVNTHGEIFVAAYEEAPANREQGSRLRDASGRESGAAPSDAGIASVSVPLSDGAPANREQGSRLRDASGRESGAAPSSAGAASVSVPSDGALPVFVGPPESVKEMAIQYRYFQRSLATIGRVPVRVQVSPRRAWQIRLDSGLTIELGRERLESRLDGFVAAFERTVGQLQRPLDYVDLRYSNGFAVRIPELKREPRDPRRDGGSDTKRG